MCRVEHWMEMCHEGHETEGENNGVCHVGHLRYFLTHLAQQADGLALLGGFERLSTIGLLTSVRVSSVSEVLLTAMDGGEDFCSVNVPQVEAVVVVWELAWMPEQVQRKVQELLHARGRRRAQLEVAGSEEDESVDAWVEAYHDRWVIWYVGISEGDWAQSTHRFSACEHDKGLRRVLNVTALVVAFLLPLFWVVVCMRVACRTLGRHANINRVKAMPYPVAFSQGSLLRGFAERFDGLAVLLACSHRDDVVRSGGNAGSSCSSGRLAYGSQGDQNKLFVTFVSWYPRFFVSQARVFVVLGVCPRTMCTIEAYVVCPGHPHSCVELYVRLRERRQRAATCVCGFAVACSALVVGGTDTSRRTGPQLVLFLVPHSRELWPESLKLDLSSLTVRLRGSSCVVLSGLDTGVMNQYSIPMWWHRSFRLMLCLWYRLASENEEPTHKGAFTTSSPPPPSSHGAVPTPHEPPSLRHELQPPEKRGERPLHLGEERKGGKGKRRKKGHRPRLLASSPQNVTGWSVAIQTLSRRPPRLRPKHALPGDRDNPTDWAQSTHRFSAHERDKGLRRVLNVTALVVAFLLPMFWVVVCMRAACRTLGWHADINLLKATPYPIAFRAAVRSVRPEELAAGFCWAIRWLGGAFGVFSPRGKRREFVFFRKVGYWHHELVVFVVCPGGGTVVFVVLWWYLVEVGIEVELYSMEVML
ncbi:hypothetical protein Taro_040429 [Colocasia esculenta]|uniref:Uncharacterized protein n=1 Tax=Colocasia esculenta TaxID=4460 RepID=A0A843WLW1_COLES|nr:hypothetical protein [Colocasia esculenta]